jgi:hypothetical protein
VSNLSKLQKSYAVHLKMRDGIQNMYDAYKKSPGNQGRNLTNIKTGLKECLQTLCLIEAQTEALLGTFQFQIESKLKENDRNQLKITHFFHDFMSISELIGFSRLCPGDTYEMQIKYCPSPSTTTEQGGSTASSTCSRVRARAKIAKDGSQNWNLTNFAFRITLDDCLNIKVTFAFISSWTLVGLNLDFRIH